MGLLLRELEHELTKYVVIYRSYRQQQPALAAYAELTELARAVTSRPPGAERTALIPTLVAAQRASPHPLWQTLLLLAFAPMLRQLSARVHTDCPEDLDERIVLTFLEAVARVGAEPPDRVSMRLRQATARGLFRALHREKVTQRLEREAAHLTCGPPPRGPGGPEVSDLVASGKRGARVLLGTVGEHGQLRAFARVCRPDASSAEIERVYRRLQQRRRRLLLRLRGAKRAA